MKAYLLFLVFVMHFVFTEAIYSQTLSNPQIQDLDFSLGYVTYSWYDCHLPSGAETELKLWFDYADFDCGGNSMSGTVKLFEGEYPNGTEVGSVNKTLSGSGFETWGKHVTVTKSTNFYWNLSFEQQYYQNNQWHTCSVDEDNFASIEIEIKDDEYDPAVEMKDHYEYSNDLYQTCSAVHLDGSLSDCVIRYKLNVYELNNGTQGNSLYSGGWINGSLPNTIDFDAIYSFTNGEDYQIELLTKDGDDNSTSQQFDISFSSNTVTQISVSPSSANICEGVNQNLTASGYIGTYSWTPSTYLANSTGSNNTFSNASAGTYTITVGSQSNEQCVNSGTVTITVNPLPIINLSSNPAYICDSETPFQLLKSVTPSGGSGTWSGSSCAITSAGIFDPIGGGCNVTGWSYDFGFSSVTYSHTTNEGCTASASVAIDYHKPSTLNLLYDDPSCAVQETGDGSASVTPSGGSPFTYKWYSDINQTYTLLGTTSTIANLEAGNYIVSVTALYNNNGDACAHVEPFTLVSPPPVSVSASSIAPAPCPNTSLTNQYGSAEITFSGGAGSPWLMNTGSGYYSVTAPSSTPQLVAGTYTVSIKDANGCVGTASPLTINSTSSFGFASGFPDANDATCVGVNNGSIDITVSGGTANYTYQWAPGSGNVSQSGINYTVSSLATSASNYYVTVTDAATDYCRVTAGPYTIGATIPTPFSLSMNPIVQPTCNGVVDGELTADDGATSPSYLWSTGAITAMVTGLTNATYTVTVTETAGTASGCKVVASQVLTAANLEKWQQASGGNNSPVEDHPVAILTDAGDNVFVAGTFIDQTKFGLNAINAASSAGGEKGSFLVKYDECGDIEWVKHTDVVINSGTDVVFVDAVLSGSYVYAIGRRSESFDFDFDGTGTSLTPTYMWFILEIDASTGALNNDISISNTLTASDLVYDLELYYNGTSTDFYAGGKQASSGKATVWKITSGGSVSTFVQDQAGSANSQVRDVEFDATNNRMYMCGTANAAFSFTTGLPESVAGVSDAFAVRYTISSGTPTFTHQRKAGASTSPGYAEGLSLEWDGGSYLYLTGNYKVGINNWGSLTSGFDNAFITKLGASDLSHQWSSHADNALSLSWAKANDICIDASGTVIAAGTFQGSGIRIASGAPGGSPGNSTGTGMWMAAIESNQTNNWTLSAICSTSTENASGVAIAAGSSSTYATGIFEHHLDLQSTSDDLNHANAGSNIDAVFTLRLGDIYTNGSLGQFYKTSWQDQKVPETGINPMAMTAFPNPTSGNITLQWNNSMESLLTLTLMDVSGRLVASPKVIDGRAMTAEMDCSSLPAGIYYLNVESVELVWKAKIIKQ